jgi:hypothetical protein
VNNLAPLSSSSVSLIFGNENRSRSTAVFACHMSTQIIMSLLLFGIITWGDIHVSIAALELCRFWCWSGSRLVLLPLFSLRDLRHLDRYYLIGVDFLWTDVFHWHASLQVLLCGQFFEFILISGLVRIAI